MRSGNRVRLVRVPHGDGRGLDVPKRQTLLTHFSAALKLRYHDTSGAGDLSRTETAKRLARISGYPPTRRSKTASLKGSSGASNKSVSGSIRCRRLRERGL